MKTLLVVLVGLVACGTASAQTGRSNQSHRSAELGSRVAAAVSAPQQRRAKLARVRAQSAVSAGTNANTVTVVAGTPGGTYYRAASDLAFVLDGEHLRVLPLLGKGAGQNAYDIRFLRGVDLGFVRTDTLQQLREDKRIIDPERHITYVARLFNDELHVIAGRDITDVRKLEGKKVSFDVQGSGTDYTGRSMFKALGIEVQIVNLDQPASLDLLKRGELAAVVSVAAKPVAVLSSFEGGDRFHLLPVPYVEAVAAQYFPATLAHEDYPKLVPAGPKIETLSVGTVLGAYSWPENSERYRRIARFVEAFFSKFDEFLAPSRHPKWSEVNFAADVPGWKRFPAAQQWLDRHTDEPTTTSSLSGIRGVQQGSHDRERKRADLLGRRLTSARTEIENLRAELARRASNDKASEHQGMLDRERERAERLERELASARTELNGASQPAPTLLTGDQEHQTTTYTPGSMSSPQPPDPHATSSVPQPNQSRLLARADTLLQAGDISGARLVLERAVAEGSAVATFKLAETYDPRQLARWNALGVQGDWARAQALYERAQAAGIAQARLRIAAPR